MFSVVIPLFNKERTILNTLQSVFEQDFSDFEVIVIDDGSTDRSLELANSFKDKRLQIYSNEHKGVSEARNFGILKSNFDYIAFLDADDYWSENYLREMSDLILKFPDCAIYGSAYWSVKSQSKEAIGNTLKEGIIEDYFYERLQQRIMRTSATIVKRDVLRQLGGFPEGMVGGEDEYTWTKIALQHNMAFTPKVLATYNDIYSGFLCRIGQEDKCSESWFDFYKAGEFYRNEFIAQKAIIAGMRYALGPSKVKSLDIERKTQYARQTNPNWYYLYLLNRYPLEVAQFLFKLRKRLIKLKSLLNLSRKENHKAAQNFEVKATLRLK